MTQKLNQTLFSNTNYIQWNVHSDDITKIYLIEI